MIKLTQILNISIIILLFIIILILLFNRDTFINTGFVKVSIDQDVPNIQGLTVPISYMSKPTNTIEPTTT